MIAPLLKKSLGSLALFLSVFTVSFCLIGCGARPTAPTEAKEEAISRTEFTERIENFFEYEPLKANQAGHFLIHLTDLSDGSPVEKADVTVVVRPAGGGAETVKTQARVGKVTGIYVAELTIAKAGNYDIEFQVRNAKLDERMPLKDFKVD